MVSWLRASHATQIRRGRPAPSKRRRSIPARKEAILPRHSRSRERDQRVNDVPTEPARHQCRQPLLPEQRKIVRRRSPLPAICVPVAHENDPAQIVLRPGVTLRPQPRFPRRRPRRYTISSTDVTRWCRRLRRPEPRPGQDDQSILRQQLPARLRAADPSRQRALARPAVSRHDHDAPPRPRRPRHQQRVAVERKAAAGRRLARREERHQQLEERVRRDARPPVRQPRAPRATEAWGRGRRRGCGPARRGGGGGRRRCV